MLDAILRKEIGRTRLQGVDGEELVAVLCEQQHRRAIAALAQRLQKLESFVRRQWMAEQHEIDAGQVQVCAIGPAELG